MTVTRGALQNLNRDQLQGVIAHEFSHTLDGDMRLSMRLIGLIFGLMAIAGGPPDDAAVVRGDRAWISRKRECLADASAVQFTRNPDGLRDTLLKHIGTTLGQRIADSVREAAPASAALAPMLRLPAVLQLFPALRPLPSAERLHFAQVLRELTPMDGSLSVFEYALEKLVTRGLAAQGRPRAAHGSLTLVDRDAQLGVVFSVLAQHGARDAVRARQAYEAGIAPLLPRRRPAYSIIDDWVPVFDQSLDELCTLQIEAKQLLIEGLVRSIAHDEVLTPAEAELLRAICAVLECPLPPLLG